MNFHRATDFNIHLRGKTVSRHLHFVFEEVGNCNLFELSSKHPEAPDLEVHSPPGLPVPLVFLC